MAWEDAELFSLDECDECLHHDDWEEVLRDCLPGEFPVTVYGYKRMAPPSDADRARCVSYMTESMSEWWRDEWGDPDDALDPDEEFKSKLVALVTEWVAKQEVWAHEVCGERTFTAEEAQAALGRDGG